MRQPQPAKIERINYPRVMCNDWTTHVYHDYQVALGWYHCCGVGPHRCEASSHRTKGLR